MMDESEKAPKLSVASGSCAGGLGGLLCNLVICSIPILREHAVANGFVVSNPRYRALVSGAGGAMLGAAYIGTHNFLAKKRGVEDVGNFIGAGCSMAAIPGLASPGTPLVRVVAGMGVAAINVAGAFPVNSLYAKIKDDSP